MSKITYVFDYEDGKEPSVHAGMSFCGGKLSAVSFSDVIEERDQLEELLDGYKAEYPDFEPNSESDED